MNKSFILLASIILTSFTGFSQNQEIVPMIVPNIQNTYHGCCAEVVRHESSGYTQTVIQEAEPDKQSLDITDPELDGFGAAPNPTKGELTISLPLSFVGFEIQVIDMTGRFVGSPIPITGSTEKLTLEGESGVYLISVRTEKEIITKRVLLDK